MITSSTRIDTLPSPQALRLLPETDPLQRQRLQSIDTAVKAHEKTHLALLGGYAKGGIAYDSLIMPDGSHYAVGGSVGVDMEPVPGDPAATLRKARVIRLAALAPHTPSGADMKIAAAAYRMEMEARRTLAQEKEGVVPAAHGAAPLPIAAHGAAPPLTDRAAAPVPGNPMATLRKMRALRSALMQENLSADTNRLLVKAYQAEMAAKKSLASGSGKIEVYA